MISAGAINTLLRRPLNDPLSSDQLTLPSLTAYARYYYKRKPQLAILVTLWTHPSAQRPRPSDSRRVLYFASGVYCCYYASLLYTTVAAVGRYYYYFIYGLPPTELRTRRINSFDVSISFIVGILPL